MPARAYWRPHYEGWPLLGLELPNGQITYHVPEKFLPLFKDRVKSGGPEWDGHDSKTVVKRLQIAAQEKPERVVEGPADAEALAEAKERAFWLAKNEDLSDLTAQQIVDGSVADFMEGFRWSRSATTYRTVDSIRDGFRLEMQFVLQELVEALEYYAHPEHYEERETIRGPRAPGVLVEGGQKAREALKTFRKDSLPDGNA
jgi:hypothetical protein